MRNLILLLILTSLMTTSFAQMAYLRTGTNFLKFNFNRPDPMSTPLKSWTGSNYEMVFSNDLKSDNFSDSIGVILTSIN